MQFNAMRWNWWRSFRYNIVFVWRPFDVVTRPRGNQQSNGGDSFTVRFLLLTLQWFLDAYSEKIPQFSSQSHTTDIWCDIMRQHCGHNKVNIILNSSINIKSTNVYIYIYIYEPCPPPSMKLFGRITGLI